MPATTDPFDEYIARYCNWGRWGADDDVGTANLITAGPVRDTGTAGAPPGPVAIR
jgi:hypothetical protein